MSHVSLVFACAASITSKHSRWCQIKGFWKIKDQFSSHWKHKVLENPVKEMVKSWIRILEMWLPLYWCWSFCLRPSCCASDVHDLQLSAAPSSPAAGPGNTRGQLETRPELPVHAAGLRPLHSVQPQRSASPCDHTAVWPRAPNSGLIFSTFVLVVSGDDIYRFLSFILSAVIITWPLVLFCSSFRAVVYSADLRLWRLWLGAHDNSLSIGSPGGARRASNLLLLHRLVQG